MATTYTAPNRIEIRFNAANDRMFYAAQALLSQYLLEVNEDRLDRDEVMADAIDEWSDAVRHGFVCC